MHIACFAIIAGQVTGAAGVPLGCSCTHDPHFCDRHIVTELPNGLTLGDIDRSNLGHAAFKQL